MPTNNQAAAGGDSPAPQITVEDAVAFLADIDMYDEWPREVMVDQEKDAKIRAIAALLTDLQGTVERQGAELKSHFDILLRAKENAANPNGCTIVDFQDVWLEQSRARIEELEAQVAEREGAIPHAAIQKTIDRVRTGICCRHIDHVNLCCDCAQITDEFAKLLTPPAGKE